jgi:hypothetical protein
MAVQTISTTGDIPEVLDPFYTGRPGAGTVGQPGYKRLLQGCLIGGFLQFTLTDLLVQQHMPNSLQPLIEQGLIGAGTVAPMSQFQQALGTQLAGMTMPDQFRFS